MKEFLKEPDLVRLTNLETQFLWQHVRLNDGKEKEVHRNTEFGVAKI